MRSLPLCVKQSVREKCLFGAYASFHARGDGLADADISSSRSFTSRMEFLMEDENAEE